MMMPNHSLPLLRTNFRLLLLILLLSATTTASALEVDNDGECSVDTSSSTSGGNHRNNNSSHSSNGNGNTNQQQQQQQQQDYKPIALTIINDSLSPIDIYWVNPTNSVDLTLMNVDGHLPHGYQTNNPTPWTTYAGHEFEIKERPNSNDGQQCNNKAFTCRRTLLEIENVEVDHLEFVIDRNFEIKKRKLASRSQSSPDQQAPPQKCKMQILNQSGASIDLYWIHPVTGEAHNMNERGLHTAANGDIMTIDGYTNHVFEARQLQSQGAGGTGSVRFQTPYHEAPSVTITQQMQVLWNEQDIGTLSRTNDNNNFYGQQQHTQIRQLLQYCQSQPAPTACLEEHLGYRFLQTQEELAFEKSLRENVGAKLEEYSCNNDALGTTQPKRIEQWYQHPEQNEAEQQEQPREVWIMLDRPTSKIHLIHDFISDEECQAMEEAAIHKLERATVADGKGGVNYNPHRKALQAGIDVPWELEAANNPIATLSRRVYDYTNHVLDLNIEEFGQEHLMSIQYKGKEKNTTDEEPPDQYKPHCDGACDGLPHKNGTRMATMVMYCTIPTKGGHTNFRNANVHVKPLRHMAVFFSYMDPQPPYLMDTGFTEHSGCPVWGGEKKIVTQWVRLGVSAETPHSSFNTRKCCCCCFVLFKKCFCVAG